MSAWDAVMLSWGLQLVTIPTTLYLYDRHDRRRRAKQRAASRAGRS